MYYSIKAEMIIAQPSSHSGTDNTPGTLAARVKKKKKEERRRRRKKKEERRKKKKKINSVHGFASSWRLAARRPEPTRGNRLPALTRWFVGLHLNQVH